MGKDKVISFIQPSRNNLKYLKWSYNSIRKNLGYRHEICVASDYSEDGTEDWCKEISEKDINFKYIVNDGTWFGQNKGEKKRMGHTLLYDKLIEEVATNDVVMIFHADMYITPGADEAIFKHIKHGTVVSLTRIEPPLHPDGPEKLLQDFGIEPEEFKEQELLKYIDTSDKDWLPKDVITKGIFAPWAIYKKDFLDIGGHDPLFAPQSKEDSDIFNRFKLNGYKFVQTWEGFVYHMTCRGSRFAEGAKRNPDGQVFMKGRETQEWLDQNQRSTRNFLRKWGSMVKHDEYMNPIILPKYDIGLVVTNCDLNILYHIEPWCSKVFADISEPERMLYIGKIQNSTLYDMKKRIYGIEDFDRVVLPDVIVRFDGSKLTQENFKIITQLPEILEDSGEVGKFDLDIFDIEIRNIVTTEYDNVFLKKKIKEYYISDLAGEIIH